MIAKNLTNQNPGGKRVRLINVLPLDTPMIVQVFPTYSCNFKCNYCIFSISKKERHFISDNIQLDWNLFKNFIFEAKEFPQKIKVLRFVGIGEPLLHSNIIDMIEYSYLFDVAEKIEIITNGSLLTKQMSDNLIKVGLDRLVISIQGISSKAYKKTSNINIDFDKFIENIYYFYRHKKNTHVYIKIVDTALKNKEDENKFYEIFGDICDSIAIEKTVPIHNNVKAEIENKTTTQFGENVKDIKICPQPFFTMQLNPDGNIVPCYSFEYPKIIGNIKDEHIVDIWNGENFRNFRKDMIIRTRNFNSICRTCNIMKYRISKEDNLDKYQNILKNEYK